MMSVSLVHGPATKLVKLCQIDKKMWKSILNGWKKRKLKPKEQASQG